MRVKVQRSSRRRWRLCWLAIATVIMPLLLWLPAGAAPPDNPPSDVPTQGAIVVNAVDSDSDNQLWECQTRRVPFGNEDIDRLRCFSFRYRVPPGGISNAVLHVAIKPLGSLQDTDSLAVAIGQPYADCAWAAGAMPGCVTLHGGFRGDETSLDLDLLNMACDPSVQGSPEAQQALLAQLQSGALHFMLQDDTTVFGAHLVLNGGPPTFPCGTSVQAKGWEQYVTAAQQSSTSSPGAVDRALTGTPSPRPLDQGAVAGAAVAGTACLSVFYLLINRLINPVSSSGAAATAHAPALEHVTPDKASVRSEETPGTSRQAVGRTASLAEKQSSPSPKSGGDQDSDLRDALDQLKDHLEGLTEPKEGPVAHLVVTQGQANQPTIELVSASVAIGQDASNHLVLLDPFTSGKHAVVRLDDGAWVIADLNSTHGTYVNGTRVKRHVLRHGDQIQVGRTAVLTFLSAAPTGWKCARCGRSNLQQDRFCGSCGAPRARGG